MAPRRADILFPAKGGDAATPNGAKNLPPSSIRRSNPPDARIVQEHPGSEAGTAPIRWGRGVGFLRGSGGFGRRPGWDAVGLRRWRGTRRRSRQKKRHPRGEPQGEKRIGSSSRHAGRIIARDGGGGQPAGVSKDGPVSWRTGGGQEGATKPSAASRYGVVTKPCKKTAEADRNCRISCILTIISWNRLFADV